MLILMNWRISNGVPSFVRRDYPSHTFNWYLQYLFNSPQINHALHACAVLGLLEAKLTQLWELKMIHKLSLAAALSTLIAGSAFAEVHEVQMLNKTDDSRMAFDPAFLQISEGDTVKFLASDKGHNAETIKGMIPKNATHFAGKINEEIEVKFDTTGIYGIKCKPHFAMGMVMTIAVGSVDEIPDTFLEGRLSKNAKKRFKAQIESLQSQ